MSDLELYKSAMVLRDWGAIGIIEDKIEDAVLRKRVRDRRIRLFHQEEGDTI